jgi:type II secretory pathway pseudopilin PulG
MLLRNTRPEPTTAEDGYLLLTVLVMVFLLLLALSVAAPKVAKQIQRDKEEEAIQRGLQYKRAIRLYYKKFGAYPSDIKQLENTNQIRFLRKRYKDPITGQDDWRLIHMGEAKVPPLGFFGEPLQVGMSSVSTGPGGATPGLYAPDTPGVGNSENGSSGNSGNTGNNGNSGTSGSSSFGFNNSNSNTGFNNTSTNPTSGSSGGFGFSNSNNSTPPTAGPGQTPTGTTGPGTGTGIGSSGNTFGSGGPIVGVGIPVKKDSLIDYHKQKKYSDWEFVYDPQEELLMNGGGIVNGGNVNGIGTGSNPTGNNNSQSGSPGTSGSGSSFGFGNGNSGGNSGSSFGFGNSGSGPTTPTTPSNPNPQQ